ncbi:MAG: hypothetical protein EBZ47_06725 [Chlamydiae bacterium]|nr:hypothetical protein [Chlamydiota bacterium]
MLSYIFHRCFGNAPAILLDDQIQINNKYLHLIEANNHSKDLLRIIYGDMVSDAALIKSIEKANRNELISLNPRLLDSSS